MADEDQVKSQPSAPPAGPRNRAIFITRDTDRYAEGRVLIDRDGAIASEVGSAGRLATPNEIGVAGLALEIDTPEA